MPRDLDDLIRAAGAEMTPDPAATARARARVLAGTPKAAGRLRRMLGLRRGRAGALAIGLLLAGGGATATVGVLADRGGDGPPWRPLPQNCFALDGYAFSPPPLRNAVASGPDGRAAVVWVTGDGVVASADQSADGSWSTPARLSPTPSDDPVTAALAANDRGDMAVAWTRDLMVEVAVRPAGGSWSSPRRLSAEGRLVIAFGPPGLAVGPLGEVGVTWDDHPERAVERSGAGFAISGPSQSWITLGRIDGTWASPRALDGLGELLSTGAPALAFDADGVPLVAASSGASGVVVAEIEPRTGALVGATTRSITLPPRPRALGKGASFSGPVIAAGPDGTMVVAWSSSGIVTAAIRAPGGSWGRPSRVSRPGAEGNDPQIGVGPDGWIAATWSAVAPDPVPGRPGRRSRAVLAAVAGPGGGWGTPTTLSGDRQVVSAPTVAVGIDGRVSVVWALGTNGISGRDSRVVAADRARDGDWGQVAEISERGLGPLYPVVAADSSGGRVAVWSRCDGRRRGIVRAASGPAPTWSAPSVVARPE